MTESIYLECRECSKPTLRYSSTIDGLRCQTCGVSYAKTSREWSIFIWKDGSIHSFAGHNEGAKHVRVREISTTSNLNN